MKTQDLQRFSAAALAIHQCQTSADLGPALVQALGALCESDSEVVQTIGGNSLQVCGSSRELSSDLLEIQNNHITEHPLFWIIGHAAAGGEPVAGKWSDHTTLQSFRQTGLYHDFFRVLEVQHQAAATVRVNDEMTLGLSLHRARGDFRREEVQLFQLLLPHVREATRRIIGQAEVAAALELRERAIGGEAALIVDETGALLLPVSGRRS